MLTIIDPNCIRVMGTDESKISIVRITDCVDIIRLQQYDQMHEKHGLRDRCRSLPCAVPSRAGGGERKYKRERDQRRVVNVGDHVLV